MNDLQDIPLWLFFLLAAGLLLQGTCLFRNARKRGKRAWFWGLWGITGLPMPTVVYLLVVVLPDIVRRSKVGNQGK
ncbi:hypothetical protein PaeBR_20375 [Paenibacillus sp. BR2-3]|uniref:hypothetical protein n=1 Tax=Paenibacillus sp. BR2-3 TaxID=3048494 RepID=UPI003977D110